jgi:hypothetical protein
MTREQLAQVLLDTLESQAGKPPGPGLDRIPRLDRRHASQLAGSLRNDRPWWYQPARRMERMTLPPLGKREEREHGLEYGYLGQLLRAAAAGWMRGLRMCS